MAESRTFGSGPFNGVRFTSEPYDDAPNVLNQLVNGYIPDPIGGSAVYSRPGFVTYGDPVGASPQGVHLHVGADGEAYNFVVLAGKLYRVSANGTRVDVTPSGVTIDASAPVYFVSLGDAMIVNDGVNVPWIGTSLSSTPITGAEIAYRDSGLVLLRALDDRNVANTAFEYVINNATYTKSANLNVGSLIPVGTLPADKWASYRVSVNTSGTVTIAGASANYTTGYNNEAAAIAALPATPVGEWNMGYFTVKAEITPWIAQTDALAGGTTGNPAGETNYYAGASYPWVAYGQPVVYAGSVFFILSSVSTESARSSIVWSEPNMPAVGYQQTDYDNVWELTQTSSDPLYAFAATNDALYYFRQLSIGALGGTPNINFQNTATHDVVSGNIGCVAPRTVSVFLNYVYFVDAQGRPYRFAVGGSPEPLWTQAREYFDNEVDALTTDAVEEGAVGVVEPNLNLWLVRVPSAEETSVLVFDALTGVYEGIWLGLADTAGQWLTCGIFAADVDALGGGGRKVVFGTDAYLSLVSLRSEDVWEDSATSPSLGYILVQLFTGWMGFSLRERVQLTELRALLDGSVFGDAAGDTSGILLASSTTQTDEATGFVGPLDTLSSGLPRYVRPTNTQLFGRGARILVLFWTDTEQAKVYRVEMEGVPSRVTIRDR